MGCYNSTVIKAPAGKVWAVLKDFHNLSWSKNVVSKVAVIGNKSGTEVGAKRILNDAFHETLLSIDNEKMQFTYSIDDGPAVVSKDNVTDYVGTVKVFSVSDTGDSFVLWTSKWASEKEEGVADFCNPIYHAILQDLKSHFA
ncbi:MAG: SRPBCC family protein [Flavobacteriaceae bacterium]|nr:SRPBCC family protein [Flavobacteriaceae bacterium]